MCALLTNGSARRKIKEESQHETSAVKKAYDLKRFAPLSYLNLWILLWPAIPICLSGSSKKRLPPDSHIHSLFTSPLWKTQSPLDHREEEFLHTVNRPGPELWPIKPCKRMTQHFLHANATWLMDPPSNSAGAGRDSTSVKRPSVHPYVNSGRWNKRPPHWRCLNFNVAGRTTAFTLLGLTSTLIFQS